MDHIVINIIRKVLGDNELSSITLSTELSQLPFDSLLFVELIVELEEEFNIEFDVEAMIIEYFNTIKELVFYVKNKTASFDSETCCLDEKV